MHAPGKHPCTCTHMPWACPPCPRSALADALASNSSLQHLNLGSNKGFPAAAVTRLAVVCSDKGKDCALTYLDLAAAALQVSPHACTGPAWLHRVLHRVEDGEGGM